MTTSPPDGQRGPFIRTSERADRSPVKQPSRVNTDHEEGQEKTKSRTQQRPGWISRRSRVSRPNTEAKTGEVIESYRYFRGTSTKRKGLDTYRQVGAGGDHPRQPQWTGINQSLLPSIDPPRSLVTVLSSPSIVETDHLCNCPICVTKDQHFDRPETAAILEPSREPRPAQRAHSLPFSPVTPGVRG